MKLTRRWRDREKPTISFELFPPRTPKAAKRLDKVIAKLAALEPDFVSVTFGAGGSTREGSLRLADKLKNEQGLETLAYFAGYGLGPEDISSVLTGYQQINIENVLVVRGDEPRGEEPFNPHPQSMLHASDLLSFIRPRFDFCLGAAGYPEGHIQAESKDSDLHYLKLKQDHGAEFIIANYFYDTRYFLDFQARCEEAGIQVPVVAGVMPIYNVKMMESLASLCGATITEEIQQGLAKLPEGDKAALNAFGVDFALRQCRELLAAGVAGLHIYTMDRSKSAVPLVQALRAEGIL